MENLSKTRYFTIAILFATLSFVFGVYFGDRNRPEIDKILGISGKELQVATTADFSPFWKVWNTMSKKYPLADEISDQDRVYGAISGLVGSLNDPYSVFFTPDEAKSFEEEITGNFDGIGMEVGIKDKVLTVIAPLKDTPAYKADIKSGDKILKINEKVTTGLSIEEAIKLIRGPKGTAVTLTIFRDGIKQPKEIKIVRDTIEIPTLDTEMRKDGIFVIKLYSFSANSVNLFRNAIKQFVDSESDKLLLDLRGNPGGYLDAAVDMASWFLKGGTVIVTEDYGNNKAPEIFRSKGYDIFNNKLKFVILIDGGSASASEILAGAMQDNGRAKLVGAQSFGKGSVQEVVDITSDTILKITVANWLTPNGTSISEKGLTPDYPVEITQKDIDAQKDPQMDKAIQLLINN
ncbi:MAG: Carboxy-terminal-processing protease [Candidatus Nomurabacteria bacterium GW2011_GWB1_40_7]|uniref:Carboxy-terminal-processing protease n=1 Tax=Candidatus Nomurabacteria bacterium GW2011_GWB1_40_7 TaxID=1618744 RepID=A0A0G0SZX7_9BACT|nr:MAG: Carboxy-terminal-processing protease [Candidatus Nomurabacteria bacterium GW2011_GWB1_40_7]